MAKKKIKKKYWVARDKSTNYLYAYTQEPERKINFFSGHHGYLKIDDEYTCLFQDVTWENSPKLIRVKVKRKNQCL